MTEKQARQLKVGDKVYWQGNTEDHGEIVDVGYSGVSIEWNDGSNAIVTFQGDPRWNAIQAPTKPTEK